MTYIFYQMYIMNVQNIYYLLLHIMFMHYLVNFSIQTKVNLFLNNNNIKWNMFLNLLIKHTTCCIEIDSKLKKL